MSKYEKYENRLHRIVVHSADVLPEKVSFYLSELAKSGNYYSQEDLICNFQDFKSLVDSIPKEFVDFLISVLSKKPISPEDASSMVGRITTSLEDKNFGINEILKIFPPAPIQGPFLYLLLNNEDEGLRLVHTLTNAATDKWREYQQQIKFDRPAVTPLPVTISLHSGIREFWGDTDVYCWFRGTTVGPYPVISALMALEEWMERQIEAGRDVEALFEKVLSASNSVAVLGICVSMALAYPNECLKTALPIVTCSGIWKMDISRQVYDRNNSWNLLKDYESDAHIKMCYSILERRNKRPQRSCEIRKLAVHYLFFSDDSLRVVFEESVENFTKILPFRYEEEKSDPIAEAALREDMENYQIVGRRENYQQWKEGENRYIAMDVPEEIKKRNEELLTPIFKLQRWQSLYLWAEQTINDGRPQERMNLEEAVAAAKELQTSEDLAETDKEDIIGVIRIKAIVGVAAAILVADFDWTRTQNHLEWCRAILLEAARMDETSMYAMSPSSVKVYAGRGLTLLATYDVADIEVRQQIFELISKSLRRFTKAGEVVKSVFGVLKNAWYIDPVLCWNALSLCLSLSIIPQKLYSGTHVGRFAPIFDKLKDWEDNVIQDHFDYLERNEIPELPRIPTVKNIVFIHEQVEYGLYALPLTELCRDLATKNKLLQICDDLVTRTIIDNLPIRGEGYSGVHKCYTWTGFIFNWAAYLAKSLSVEEIRQHILTPLRDNWSQVPELTAALLDAYISHHIAYVEGPSTQSLEIWKEICNWVLDSPEIAKKASYDYLDRDTGEVLQLIAFTRHGSSRIKDDWQYAHLFRDIFDKWISVAGHNSYAYSHLLTMLKGIGWQFAPEQTLEWLNQCASNAVHDLWNEDRRNGSQTAQLLNRIWNSFERQIRGDKILLEFYSDLVYRLVKAGIPLASTLQYKLEERK
ncbi:hypothetical protein NG791_23225 [Laspinema sp. D1]|uniref:hypothetical protein n=1 Tax=Laspinema palackyanum TaxID=3231601 RepID=UPI003478589B|nr:hypothetical protein [Laspinema sp. D2b]